MFDLNLIPIFLAKLGLSLLLGLFVGYEREHQEKPAGIRDVALVSLGATLFTIIALELINYNVKGVDTGIIFRYDIGRILAYIIVSMGFLGSGVIVHTKDKLEGITTAGVLWTFVAIGILVGLGKFIMAIIATLFIYFVLKLKYIRVKIISNKRGNYGKKKK